MRHRIDTAIPLAIGIVALALVSSAAGAQAGSDNEITAHARGHPDLSGTYDVATLTPLERPTKFGDKPFLTREEAEKIEEQEQALMARGQPPERSRPRGAAEGGRGGTAPRASGAGQRRRLQRVLDRSRHRRVHDRRQVPRPRSSSIPPTVSCRR